MAVIGVGRFIQQRQDFENAIARSYQVEMAARVQLAAGRRRQGGARGGRRPGSEPRQELRDEISGDTRDTALLVAAGLIAGLTGALLLFTGLIASMRRPLEELVDAAGRLAARRPRRPGQGRRPLGDGDARHRLQRDGRRAASSRPAERDQLDRMKDEFVLTASHELRSPLTSVQGFAELLMLERESLTPKQVETVEIILDNCRHLVRLLNDLLDLARSDAGRLAIRPRPTELAPLIEDAVRTMRARPTAPSQTLTQRIEPDLPLVEVEPDRIRQILVNLLTNAHEYRPQGANIEVKARVAGAEVEIDVIDDGPGIPEQQLEHIFERFVARRRRPDPARRRHRPRPGDLEIAGRAARRHDRGRLDARQRLDLPRPPADGAAQRRRAGAAEASLMTTGPRRRRLGDDPAADAHAAGAGRLRGRDRSRRPGGDRAGRATPPTAPDLLLLDAMMPRKSGIDALRELRAAGVETPALIVSAHQDASDADAPTDLEISGYVTKPIDFDRLLREIAELTARPCRLSGAGVSRRAGATPRLIAGMWP